MYFSDGKCYSSSDFSILPQITYRQAGRLLITPQQSTVLAKMSPPWGICIQKEFTAFSLVPSLNQQCLNSRLPPEFLKPTSSPIEKHASHVLDCAWFSNTDCSEKDSRLQESIPMVFATAYYGHHDLGCEFLLKQIPQGFSSNPGNLI